MLDGLEDMAQRKLGGGGGDGAGSNARYIRIDGRTSPQARHELVNRFQKQPGISLGILSITAAGVGLTLTAASVVVFGELHWTPGNLIQAEDRAHRIGQKRAVNVQ